MTLPPTALIINHDPLIFILGEKMRTKLSTEQRETLLALLKKRFETHMHRHEGLTWQAVEARLKENPDKLWSLHEMERTGGEPDVIGYDAETDTFVFCDCSAESPKGRRSLCYDRDAWESRKKYKPENNALDVAAAMGVEMLSEEAYFALQKVGPFDTKSSSWLKTPEDIRKLGGAIFGDFRYGRVFVYHNGAESYYAARGFRAILKV
jgi:hypothetical protein